MLKESEEDLKARITAKKKEPQDKCEVVGILATMPNVETDPTSLSNAMSHVKVRDVELTGLKKHNKNLEDTASKRKKRRRS